MPQVSVNSIGEYIRQQREQAKISLRQLSQAAGVSNPYLSQIEHGLRKPSAEILQQIAKGLRISAEAMYVQAGILEDKPADSGVRSALLADPSLSERQKQVLIEIYESFRKENGVENGITVDPAPEPPETGEAPAAIMAGALTGEEPGIRRGGRAARRARGTWAAATGGSAGTGEMPDGPLDPPDPASQGGTGWSAAGPGGNEE